MIPIHWSKTNWGWQQTSNPSHHIELTRIKLDNNNKWLIQVYTGFELSLSNPKHYKIFNTRQQAIDWSRKYMESN